MSAITPTQFIRLLRESDSKFMTNLFNFGACFHLYRILATIWPNAEPWHVVVPGHVITRINGVFYDINGRVGTRVPRTAELMTENEQRKAKRWLRERFRQHGKGVACLCSTEANVIWRIS